MIARSGMTALLLGILVISASGCVTRYRLDVPHETALPDLDGSRVAILPAFASEGAEGAAIIGRRVSEATFCAPIGRIDFLAPTKTLETLSAGDDMLADLRDLLAGTVRGESEPTAKQVPWLRDASSGIRVRDNDGNWSNDLTGSHGVNVFGLDFYKELFHGDRMGAVELRSAIDVSIARHPLVSSAWTPATVARETFEGIPADFVLVSVAFADYRQVTAVTALAGIIPYFWSQDLQAARPSTLFVLYETASGRRVWEALVSVSGRITDGDPRYAREVVDSRVMPYLGVAHLLTGEFELPFSRTLEAQDAARRGSIQDSLASDCLQRSASITAR